MAAIPPPTPRDPQTSYEHDRRARASLIRVLRVLMLLLMSAVTLLTVLRIGEEPGDTSRVAENWQTALLLAFGLAAGVIAIDVFTPVKKISTIGGVFLGLLAGMLGAVAFGFVLELISQTYDLEASRLIGAAKVLTGIALVYLGITIVLQTQDDFRLLIPYVEFAKQLRGVRPLLIDTSALIDGRIEDVARAGFLLAPVVIPRFVIAELQTLSDSADKLKRARGRRGLEMVTLLQNNPRLDLSIEDVPVAGKNVDTMLVEHARSVGAAILTTDSGLERVASIHGVGSLNLNTLAAALKPNILPGETLSAELVRKGEQPGQAVAYLDDGTMIVVDDAAHRIGDSPDLTVASTLQTTAGRMIFARLADAQPEPPAEPTRAPDPPQPQTTPKPAGPGPARRPDARRSGRRNPRRD